MAISTRRPMPSQRVNYYRRVGHVLGPGCLDIFRHPAASSQPMLDGLSAPPQHSKSRNPTGGHEHLGGNRRSRASILDDPTITTTTSLLYI